MCCGLWGLRPPTKAQLDQLFDEDMLGDDLEAWMDESTMLRRSFRNVAVIAGLIERRFPGEEKSRRQVTFSSDLIYDALRKHEPDHILLRATRQDAAWQLADLQAPRRSAEARQGPHRLSPARPHLAARRAGAAGDRQGAGARRHRRGRAAGHRRAGADRRGDAPGVACTLSVFRVGTFTCALSEAKSEGSFHAGRSNVNRSLH